MQESIMETLNNDKIVIKGKLIVNQEIDDTGFMHIAFNVNDAYFRQAAVAIISVLENNKNKNFTFHIFTDAYEQESAGKLKLIAEKYNIKLCIYAIDMNILAGFHIKVKRFSRVTYLRLIMPKILKDINYFLYMDADMVCLGDLWQLNDIDFKGKAFAAVSDLPEAVEYRTKFLKLKNDKYFNDGMMFVNVHNWNRLQITEKAFTFKGADPKRFLGQNQDILNLVMDGDIIFLDKKFNVMQESTDVKDCVIYHFFGRFKPWEMELNKYDALWRKYLELSPWPALTDKFPPKKPQYYHDYKKVAKYYKENNNWLNMIESYFWYSILKIRLKLGL